MVKKFNVLSLIAVVLGIVIAGSAVAYAFVEPIHDAVQSMVLKPEKYYEKVEKSYFSKQATSVGEMYQKVNNVVEGSEAVGNNASLKMLFGKQILEEAGYPDLKSIALNSEFSTKDKKTAENISIDYDDKRLITLNTSIDMENEIAYIQVPELSDSMISLKADELAPYLEEQGISLDEITGAFGGGMSSMMEQSGLEDLNLTEKDIQDMIKRYSDVFVETMTSDVSREKNVKGDIGDVDYKYTTLTCEITLETILSLANDLMSELKDDDLVKDFATADGVITSEDYDAQMQTVIDQIEAIKSAGGSELREKIGTMTTYVNSDMEIMGREFDVDAEGQKANFGYINVDNDKESAMKQWVSVNDEDIYRFEGSVEKNDGATTGSYDAMINDPTTGETISMTIAFEDYKIVDEEKNLVSGKVSISTEVEGIAYEFIMDCKVDNKKQTISLTFNMDKEMLITIEVSFEETEVANIVMPDANAKTYDAFNETDMESYLEELDIVGLQEKLIDVLGEDLAGDIMADVIGDEDIDSLDDGDIIGEDDGLSDSMDFDFDFANITFMANDVPFAYPAEFAVFSTIVKCEVETVKSGESEQCSDDAYSVSCTIKNGTAEDMPADKCVVTSLNSYGGEEDPLHLAFNGVKIGSTRAEVSAAFGNQEIPSTCKYLYIYDLNSYSKSISVRFEGDVVGSMSLYFN